MSPHSTRRRFGVALVALTAAATLALSGCSANGSSNGSSGTSTVTVAGSATFTNNFNPFGV